MKKEKIDNMCIYASRHINTYNPPGHSLGIFPLENSRHLTQEHFPCLQLYVSYTLLYW